MPLHTAAAPAVRAAVKTELFYRNDTPIAFFFAANKNKDPLFYPFSARGFLSRHARVKRET